MMIEFGKVRNRVCDQRTSTLRRESALCVVFVITSCLLPPSQWRRGKLLGRECCRAPQRWCGWGSDTKQTLRIFLGNTRFLLESRHIDSFPFLNRLRAPNSISLKLMS